MGAEPAITCKQQGFIVSAGDLKASRAGMSPRPIA